MHDKTEIADIAQIALPPLDQLPAHHKGTPDALGYCAVESAMQVSKLRVRGLDSEEQEYYRELDIADTRQRLEGLEPAQQRIAAKLLQPKEMPAWLRDSVEPTGKRFRRGKEILDRLTAQNADGEYEVSDETFLNVLEWHNHRQWMKQADFERDTLPVWRGRYENRVNKAISEGWLPSALRKTMGRLDNTKVWLDDGWSTTLQGFDGQVDKSYGNQEAFVRLAPGTSERVITHEFNHVLEGRDNQSPEEFPDISEDGLYRLFDGFTIVGHALNEATVEHLALSLVSGDYHKILDPKKMGSDSSYKVERGLLSVLCEDGYHKVDIRMFFAAHFESGHDREVLGKHSAAAKLQRALRRAFPFGDVVETMGALKPENGQLYDEAVISRFAVDLQTQAKKHKAVYKAGVTVGKVLKAGRKLKSQ